MAVDQSPMNKLITEHIDIWTSAVKTRSTSGRGSSKKLELYGVKKLRELILELAVRGKLVPQDPNDEPASVLLECIAEEKDNLIKEKKIRKPIKTEQIGSDEVPFELPVGWEWRRLVHLVTVLGDGLHGTPEYSENGEYFFVNGNNLSNGSIQIKPETKRVSEEQYLKHKKDLNDRTVLVSINGTLGNVGFYNNEAVMLGKSACYFNLFQDISKDYIKRLIESPYFRNYAFAVATGSTIKNLGLKAMNNFVLAVPPKAEQHRIVAKVDELMTLCDQLEQQTEASIEAHQVLVTTLLDTLTNSADADELMQNWARISEHFDTLFTTEESIDQLKQTILQLAVMGKLVPQDPSDEPAAELLKRIAEEKAQLVKEKKIKKQKALPPISEDEKPFELPSGWEWCRGDEIADFIDPQPSHRTPPKVEGGVPYIGYTDIDHNSGINFNNARKVGGNVLEEHRERYTLRVGDFVFGKIGTLGKPFFLPKPFDYCLSANLILIQPKNEHVTPKFLALYLNSPTLYQVLGEQKTNSTHGVFGIKKARLLPIPLPPIQEQDLIVAKIEELESICEQLKMRLIDSHTTKVKLTDAIVEQAM
ncbi:type I restriction endonuclease subunit S [Vibrio parahaemolyticus]|uniref:restriction endonuclease subunit S n=1 Tax=Vibrio parahaemolyticus TaxID=670 RepID=UPI001123DCB2|nr:restriction endonuclease subunit S [Vibrio parahaemolyticus]TOF39602.1 type I restriction endonuclease subunit S [Vibrio parahaemolyticus]TOF50880.1 type I restriction endonuclease subunit S [Vibrio parahaemolyticus]